jgi:hypothetical protein
VKVLGSIRNLPLEPVRGTWNGLNGIGPRPGAEYSTLYGDFHYIAALAKMSSGSLPSY